MRRLVLPVLAVLGLGAAWWLFRPTPAPAPAPAAPMQAPVSKVAPVPRPTPSDLEPPDVAPGRRSLAEAVAGVAIQCEVGSQLDGARLRGGLSPQVHEGWFSAVVPTLEGRLAVSERGGPAVFAVRWQAGAVGDAVGCEVDWLDHAVVQVEVVDPQGRPTPRTEVTGCTVSGRTDADGRVVLTVPLVEPHCVFGTVGTTPPYFGGEVGVDGLVAGEERTVTLYVEPRRRGWTRAEVEDPWSLSLPEQEDAIRAQLQEASSGERDALEDALADVERRAELQRVTERQAELLDEMDSLTTRFRDGEPGALEELSELTETMMENARARLELVEESAD